MVLDITLACNIPFASQESSESVPETMTNVAATAARMDAPIPGVRGLIAAGEIMGVVWLTPPKWAVMKAV